MAYQGSHSNTFHADNALFLYGAIALAQWNSPGLGVWQGSSQLDPYNTISPEYLPGWRLEFSYCF
ncbi:MAG: hypothetical protein ABIM46_06825 [candidate division WOR-3 bacterium]